MKDEEVAILVVGGFILFELFVTKVVFPVQGHIGPAIYQGGPYDEENLQYQVEQTRQQELVRHLR